MSFFPKGALRKVFLAAAVFTTFTGIVPSPAVPQAQAASSSAAAAAAGAAAAAAAAANARHNREAQNAVIVDPSEAHIAYLQQRGLVDRTTIPYIRATVADMKVAAGTKADDVTEAQRDQFMTELSNRRLIAEMSSDTPEQAVAKGMDSGYAPYFTQTKAEFGYSGAVTLAQAQSIQASVAHKHWENDTKPALEKGALIAGGVAAVGAAGYAIASAKRRRDGYNDY